MGGTKLHVLSHKVLLIYNIYGGTHHATKTNTIRHGKEHETPLLVYQGLLNICTDMHDWRSRLRMPTNSACQCHYDRVMDVKRAIARAVCKCHADDGVNTVVLPTNLRCNVFTTYDVDNLDSHNKGRVSWHCFECTKPSVKGKSRRASSCYSSELL